MNNVRIQDLVRKPAVRIGAAAAVLIAVALVAVLLVVPALETDSGRPSDSNSGTLSTPTIDAATPAGSPAPPPPYLLDLLNSLPQLEGLSLDAPPASAAVDLYVFYRADSAPAQLLDFYKRELVALGWQPETSFASVVPHTKLEESRATYLKFVKDDLAIIVGAAPNPDTSISAAARLLIDIAPRGGANPPAYLLDVFNSLPAPAGLTVDEPPRTTGINLQTFFWAEDKPEQVLAFYNRELVALGWQPETLSLAEHDSTYSKFVNESLRIMVAAAPNEKSPIDGATHLLIDIRPKSEP